MTTDTVAGQSASSGEPAQLAVRAVNSVALLLRRDGVFIPRSGALPEYRLALPGIALVAALDTPTPIPFDDLVRPLAKRYDTKAITFHIVLKHLRSHGFVASEPSPHWMPPAPAPARLPLDPLGVSPSDDTALVVGSPRLWQVKGGGFEVKDHAGFPMIRLSPEELAAAASMSAAASLGAAFELHRSLAGPRALDADEFRQLATRLLSLRVLEREDQCLAKDHEQAMNERAYEKGVRARATLNAHFDEVAEKVAALEVATGRPRTRVVPMHSQFITPLSLGMIVAYADQHEGGRLLEDFAFLPATFYDQPRLQPFIDSGSVFLFSDYVWSHATNLASSEEIKAANPRCLIIHGGPDAPKYEGDVEAYFAANPFIDIVVHGEGEVTFAELLDALAPGIHDGERDLSVLAEVPGLSYRTPTGVHTTSPRDRLADINVIPSPYLTGIYEAEGGGDYDEAGAIDTAMLETNRGCPYSCTFCDWGSSTASRIRKFDLERIFAEIEWFGKAKVAKIFICDANFGIFERDVEIAQKIADTYRTYGYPQSLFTNYAKNTVKHLQKIVQIMVEAGIVTEGLLSLQSMDEDTLKTIRRSNIKVEKYDALAAEFREAHLPLLIDLMIGLPGSTTRSLREDFQECIDREVNAKVFQTELLVNSPMNEPEYRAENAIVTERVDGAPAERIPTRGSAGAGRALVVSSSSFTRADYDEMLQLRAVFRLVENFAVLRLTARYLRQAIGLREADLIETLRATAHDEPDQWPYISLAMRVVSEHMVPPVSWKPFIDEIHRFAIERLGVTPTTGFETVIAVQHAILPGPGRSFPHVLEIAHDVGAWYRDVLAAKDHGMQHTWPDHVAPLETYPPTTFTIEDPSAVCELGIGFGIDVDPYASWELHSPVSRTLAHHHTVLS